MIFVSGLIHVTRPSLPRDKFDISEGDAFERDQKAIDLLDQCRRAYESLEDWRNRRIRSRNYYRSKQWERYHDAAQNKTVDEADRIREQGRIPWVFNHIRTTFTNLVGQFRENRPDRIAFGRNRQDNDAAEEMSAALRAVIDIQEVDEVDVDAFKNHLMGGMCGWKTTFGWIPELNRPDVIVDEIDPSRFFFNPDLADRRLKGLYLVGEIHDVSIEDVVQWFASDEREEQALRDIYAEHRERYDRGYSWNMTGFDRADMIDFLNPSDETKCRVIEVWVQEWQWTRIAHDTQTGTFEPTDLTDEEIDEINAERAAEAQIMNEMLAGTGVEPGEPSFVEVDRRYEPVWHCYFLSPQGHVLYTSETPYWHERHPYDFGFVELIDGESWGIIEDLIDPQRLFNRMMGAMDFMFSVGAKGVLLIPEDAIPDGVTIEEFAEEWSSFNGVIKYKPRPDGKIPQQITANSIPAGYQEFMMSMLKRIEDISGVTGAVQGHTPPSGTPATLYQQQVVQASSTNRDRFETFFAIVRRRDRKIIQLIAQFYDEPRMIAVSGQSVVQFDPARVRGIDWDVVVADVANTATYRQLFEADLKEFRAAGELTFKQYLEMSSHPKADALMKVIERTNPLLGQISEEEAAAISQAAAMGDTEAQTLIDQANQWSEA